MITYEETIELLQRAVAEKGDGYRNSSDCVYVKEGMPVCIVGHVFSYLGLLEGAESNQLVPDLPVVLANFTPAATRALRVAQDVQDGMTNLGDTWGDALIAAKEIGP